MRKTACPVEWKGRGAIPVVPFDRRRQEGAQVPWPHGLQWQHRQQPSRERHPLMGPRKQNWLFVGNERGGEKSAASPASWPPAKTTKSTSRPGSKTSSLASAPPGMTTLTPCCHTTGLPHATDTTRTLSRHRPDPPHAERGFSRSGANDITRNTCGNMGWASVYSVTTVCVCFLTFHMNAFTCSPTMSGFDRGHPKSPRVRELCAHARAFRMTSR